MVVLGCTELPLLFPQTREFDADGVTIALLDPTMLLAAACVRHAQAVRTMGTAAMGCRQSARHRSRPSDVTPYAASNSGTWRISGTSTSPLSVIRICGITESGIRLKPM